MIGAPFLEVPIPCLLQRLAACNPCFGPLRCSSVRDESSPDKRTATGGQTRKTYLEGQKNQGDYPQPLIVLTVRVKDGHAPKPHSNGSDPPSIHAEPRGPYIVCSNLGLWVMGLPKNL